MADVRAVKNGNWSDTTVWNTGALPTTADDVFSNTFTVNVDTSFEVLSLRSTSGTGITAGGSFNFNSGSVSGSCTRTIDNTSLVPGATNMVQVTATTGTVTISLGGNVSTRNANNDILINYSGNCNFVLSGFNFTPATAGGVISTSCISKTSSGLITITGNLNGGGTGAGGVGFNRGLVSTNGNTILIGNALGGLGGGVTFNQAINQSAGTLTITGNVTGGQGAATNQGILFSGTSLTINGNILGGAAAVAVDTSAPTNNITGSITGASTAAVSYATAGLLTVSGSCTAGSISPAIVSTNASATNIFTGPFINTNNTMAVQCANMKLTADANTYWDYNDITLFSPERLAFYPSASDIRQGTTYADGTVSGSLAMPPATAVIAGTPTDNTTGSAVLTPSQLQDAVWGRDLSQMTETGSIGNRLARVSTTGTTGAQIASYLL